ncbi:MAG: TIGR03067 domain-containing protein, partial [Planctomycetes bacterium]|nr:TIGR03067 domain-containing protein [Planctomycetota bacterium]
VARRIALRTRTDPWQGRREFGPAVIELEEREPGDRGAVVRGEMLNDEIGRLPESLRVPIVLCYLQGMTNREASERLGCPEGTIVSRLARARDLLRSRLLRRGLVLSSAAALTALLTETGTAAPLEPSLFDAAANARLLPTATETVARQLISARAGQLAAEATSQIARQLLIKRCELAVLALCAAWLLFGFVKNNWLTKPDVNEARVLRERMAMQQWETENAALPVIANPLEGVWEGVDIEFIGGNNPAEHGQLSQQIRWVISGDSIQFKLQNQPLITADYSIKPTGRAGPIDFTFADGPDENKVVAVPGVYRLLPDELEVCSGGEGGDRPQAITLGVVGAPARRTVSVRAGLIGYAHLRRLNRSVEAEALQGQWMLTYGEAAGTELPVDPREEVSFEDDRYVLRQVRNNAVVEARGNFKLDSLNPSRYLEMRSDSGSHIQALYEIEDDVLHLCLAAPGAPRPDSFETTPQQNHMSLRLRRPPPAGVGRAPDLPP